jgi:hypothetical protein
MSYLGLEHTHSPDLPHLGGSVKHGDPFTYCPTVWDYVINRFGVESVLDLGSGSGNASHYFHAKGLKVIAVDGYAPSVDQSIYPAIRHDLTSGPVHTKVDLVIRRWTWSIAKKSWSTSKSGFWTTYSIRC